MGKRAKDDPVRIEATARSAELVDLYSKLGAAAYVARATGIPVEVVRGVLSVAGVKLRRGNPKGVPAPHRRRSLPEGIGLEKDSVIATREGISVQRVALLRKKAGIPSYTARMKKAE